MGFRWEVTRIILLGFKALMTRMVWMGFNLLVTRTSWMGFILYVTIGMILLFLYQSCMLYVDYDCDMHQGYSLQQRISYLMGIHTLLMIMLIL